MTTPPVLAHTGSASDGESPMAGWRYRTLVWSVSLSAITYLAFALWGGWHDVSAAVIKVGLGGIAVALSLSLANYGLRFARWQLYLRRLGHSIAWRASLRIYLAGYALTTTPGKAGEAFRGVLLKRLGVPYVKSLAAFLSERLSDLLAIVILSLVGLMHYPATEPVTWLGVALAVGAYVVLSRRTPFRRTSTQDRHPTPVGQVLSNLSDIMRQAQCCHSPAFIAATTLISLIGWAAEGVAFYLILQWIGVDLPITFAVFAFAFSMLAGALSFMPGGLGTTEAVMTSLLICQNTGEADAIAATVLVRLTTLWFAAFIGVMAQFRALKDR